MSFPFYQEKSKCLFLNGYSAVLSKKFELFVVQKVG